MQLFSFFFNFFFLFYKNFYELLVAAPNWGSDSPRKGLVKEFLRYSDQQDTYEAMQISTVVADWTEFGTYITVKILYIGTCMSEQTV